MDNRFEQLRYKDKLSLNAEMSINQLAKELDISPATVSKLEHDENYDDRISIIKKYKERFPDVSYDYLLGATNTKHKQYNNIEEKLPFSNEFYESLEKMVQKESQNPAIEYMLEALLSNPDALADLLIKIYYSFQELYRYTHDDLYEMEYMSGTESIELEAREYIISHAIIEFLQTNVIPKLDRIYEKSFKTFKESTRRFLSSIDGTAPWDL